MANPQPTDAHIRIAHSITEAIMVRDFSKRQRKILDLILRLSWGCGKKYAYIPLQRDFMVVGVHDVDIKKELDWLEVSNVIIREEAIYSFNKDFEQWEVSRVKPWNPKKLSELLSLNLNGKKPLSETLSTNLVKHEAKTKLNTKLVTPTVDTSKEILKKDINTNTIKKESIKKEKYGEADNVLLTADEYKKLVDKFGKQSALSRIESLSVYIASKGKEYKSHYFTILNWDNMDKKEEGKDGAYKGKSPLGHSLTKSFG